MLCLEIKGSLRTWDRSLIVGLHAALLCPEASSMGVATRQKAARGEQAQSRRARVGYGGECNLDT